VTAEQAAGQMQRTLPVLVKVTLAAGRRRVEISADALVRARVTSSNEEALAEEHEVRNAGQTTMLAALDAMFPEASLEPNGDEPGSWVEDQVLAPQSPEQATALELRERIERAIEFVRNPDALIDEVASATLVRLLEGRA